MDMSVPQWPFDWARTPQALWMPSAAPWSVCWSGSWRATAAASRSRACTRFSSLHWPGAWPAADRPPGCCPMAFHSKSLGTSWRCCSHWVHRHWQPPHRHLVMVIGLSWGVAGWLRGLTLLLSCWVLLGGDRAAGKRKGRKLSLQGF